MTSGGITVLKAGASSPYLEAMAPRGAHRQGSALNQQSSHEAHIHELPARPEAETPPAEDLMGIARRCLEDMKAEDTIEIDLAGKTSIADAMIITSGRSHRHVGSIADKLMQELKAAGYGNARVEGLPACDWVLIDAGDLLVHIFRPEVRHFYNLEKMWGSDRPGDRLAG
ncbi:ribosome silencing factor [Methylobacterium sp. ID0610]|uniref:ribosome silencing factor n=1 Tax=Methylobacterium carpenticola TaxID=3344827 RepID=UPI003683FE58